MTDTHNVLKGGAKALNYIKLLTVLIRYVILFKRWVKQFKI